MVHLEVELVQLDRMEVIVHLVVIQLQEPIVVILKLVTRVMVLMMLIHLPLTINLQELLVGKITTDIQVEMEPLVKLN